MNTKLLSWILLFCSLGIMSCTSDENYAFETNDMPNNGQTIELRKDKKGSKGESCCKYFWKIVQKKQSNGCCDYTIYFRNDSRCEMQLVGIPNGKFPPGTGRYVSISVCGETAETFNISSNNQYSQTSKLCGSITLEPDCSTEDFGCTEDCEWFVFVPNDDNFEVQFINEFRVVTDCEEENSDEVFGWTLFNNGTDCNESQLIDLWNQNTSGGTLDVISFTDYISQVEDLIRSKPGCEDTQIIIEHTDNGVWHKFYYDCRSCAIVSLEASFQSFNVFDDCTEIESIELSGEAGGATWCGPCYQ